MDTLEPSGLGARTDPPDNLRALSIATYVMAAITALLSCFPLIHLSIGVWLVTQNPLHPPDKAAGMMVGSIFIAAAVAIILMGWIYAGCLAYAGKCLAQRRGYIFCMIMAALSCAHVPLGTILGVFTIVELNKEHIKEQFPH